MTVTVYFATNRNQDKKADWGFGNHYNPDGPYCLRYGWAEVEAPPERDVLGGDYRVKTVRVAPERIPGVNAPASGKTLRGSDAVFGALHERMRANRADLVILIHGFGCTFEDAIARAAQLKLVYATAQRPLEVAVFSWPTDGRTIAPRLSSAFRLAYFNDRTDAEASREAIARALRRMIEFFRGLPPERACNQKLHLVAHSMGNYVLRHALQSFARDFRPGGMPRLFENVFLMAADEDDDAFEHAHKFQRLPEIAAAVQVYFTPLDGALSVSDVTKGNPDRLGSGGPRTLTDLPRKVVLVDCSAVADLPGLGDALHQYYRSRAEVVADIQAVLAGTPPDGIGRDFVPASRAFRIRPAAR